MGLFAAIEADQLFFLFQAEDGIRDYKVTGVQTCALPICLVTAEMGDPEGVFMFDESGFVKKGKESVGVARQYCGTRGKVDNSQVGVFAAYASRHGYALVDTRLFLPEQWFSEDYKDRRDKCNVPDDVTFHTKPQ